MADPPATTVAQLLAASDDDLYVTLADVVVRYAGGVDRERRRDLGRAWWEAHRDTISQIVCANERIQRLRSEQGSEAALLVTAVADLLAPAIGAPPALTVAALTVKFGLDRLCGPAASAPTG